MTLELFGWQHLGAGIMACLVPHLKFFYSSHRISGHIYGILNIHKK